MVFGLGAKERLPATDALVDARCLGFFIFARKRRFGAFFAGNVKLLVGEVRPPLRIAFSNFAGIFFSHGRWGTPPGNNLKRTKSSFNRVHGFIAYRKV